MEQGLGAQLALFVGCMGLGSVLGVLYDVCRCLGVTRRGRNLWDGCFCLLATGVVLLFLLMHTGGDLRFWQLLGALLGFGGEHVCLSPLLQRGLGWCFGRLHRLARAGKRLLLWLFSFPRGN